MSADDKATRLDDARQTASDIWETLPMAACAALQDGSLGYEEAVRAHWGDATPDIDLVARELERIATRSGG